MTEETTSFSRPRRQRIGPGGLVLIALLVLVILGVGSYIGALLFGVPFAGLGSIVQPGITTTALNSTVTYAGVTITVLDIQRAQRFADDPRTSNDGMLRLQLRAQNKTTIPVNLVYSDIARLVLPGGKLTAPTYANLNGGISPGATMTSYVDFAAPNSVKTNQLLLRLGKANEVQMDIPLVSQVDLSKYAPKITNLNAHLQYLGLDWFLAEATTQFSIDGQQADKGMRYVVLILSVNNALSQIAIPGSAYDYIRLKVGDATIAPTDTTLPVAFEAGAKRKTGTVTFLIPQNTTTLTLILLAQRQGGFDQAMKDFQL